jgi:hypothetical protein
MRDLISDSRRKVRQQFLHWCFVAGACAPVAWIGASYALRSWSVSSDHLFDTLLFALACATFPTQFLFLDTEHLPEIIFMLVIAMPVNGVWFTLVGSGLWYLREGFNATNGRRQPSD